MSKARVLVGSAWFAIATAIPTMTHAAPAASATAKPHAKPGWVVVDEECFYPLRRDSAMVLHNAFVHYRQHEEKAAANEIRKAVSWVKYAAGHALPVTQVKLATAESELSALAVDLDKGNVVDAARLEDTLTRASQTLAEWHYYKAKELYGRDEAGFAAMNLDAAVAHLRHAAETAHYEFGPDTITLFDSVQKPDKQDFTTQRIATNILGDQLDGVEHALQQLGNSLKASQPQQTTDTTPPSTTSRPASAPGWVVLEDDWCAPMRFDFLDTLHQARVNYRQKEMKTAGHEIERAVTWLRYAELDADKQTAGDLATARMDLFDFAGTLESGRPVMAKKLDAAFAHASAALAKYHHFKAHKALDEGDLKKAGEDLQAAADHLRAAASLANHEYSTDVMAIFDDYAPFGSWEEAVELTPSKLSANLQTIEQELDKLSAKLSNSK